MREEWFIERQGKRFVLYVGLLYEAHARGLKCVETELLQIPNAENENTAIVKAVVEMEDGKTFSGIGDASPKNVGKMIQPHLIRMAETRAKARALRDAINVGVTAFDELGGEDDIGPDEPVPSQISEPELREQRLSYVDSIATRYWPDNWSGFKDRWTKGIEPSRASTTSLAILVQKLKDEYEGGENVDIDSVPGVRKGVPNRGE